VVAASETLAFQFVCLCEFIEPQRPPGLRREQRIPPGGPLRTWTFLRRGRGLRFAMPFTTLKT